MIMKVLKTSIILFLINVLIGELQGRYLLVRINQVEETGKYLLLFVELWYILKHDCA